MIQLAYFSSAAPRLTGDDIAQILLKSRENNTRRAITGMLLYKGGNVLQVLEGDREQVHGLFEIIQRDPRHRGIIRMYEKPIAVRDFPEWTMGFHDLEAEVATHLKGFSEILRPDFDMRSIKPSDAEKLFAVFKSGVR